MVILLGIVSSASVTNLFPTIVKTLGYSNIASLLLTVPPYCLAVMTSFLNAWHADKTGERYFHVTLPLYIAVFAFILAAATTGIVPRYLAMMLMVPSIYTGYVVVLAWISNTIPRPPAKVREVYHNEVSLPDETDYVNDASALLLSRLSTLSQILLQYMPLICIPRVQVHVLVGPLNISMSTILQLVEIEDFDNENSSRCDERQLRHRFRSHLCCYSPSSRPHASE